MKFIRLQAILMAICLVTFFVTLAVTEKLSVAHLSLFICGAVLVLASIAGLPGFAVYMTVPMSSEKSLGIRNVLMLTGVGVIFAVMPRLIPAEAISPIVTFVGSLIVTCLFAWVIGTEGSLETTGLRKIIINAVVRFAVIFLPVFFVGLKLD